MTPDPDEEAAAPHPSTADATGLSQSAASRLLGRLRDAGLIVQTRQEGKKVFYRPTGHAAVALGVVPPAPA